ncbi:hypothetical protein BU23DRAFT_470053 [Bimuria novae-zelandiae CBS 107.79]|uniref:Uncharacterized protein n=1 Tax=Bimuria novae-zelandiae CBS 107.79 TaxID=1447943 RepID=A0A6A5V376_9PLEO|nr:hypothetical protein BU23DRAFT_470053 [Bimuria novae-zelandiae CBS 107.79]
MDAEVVLQRFNNRISEQDEDAEIGQHGDGDTYSQLRKNFDAAVANKAKVEAKQLLQSIHSLQVNNELLRHENLGLRQALYTKKKCETKRTTLDLQQDEEGFGGAVFWSPRKLREAREREAAKQDEAERLQLQKTRDREMKAAAALYKKQQAEAAKAARQRAAEERRQAKKAQAEERAAERALKKQQRNAETAAKSRDRANNSKRKASHTAAKNPAKRRRAVAAASRVDVGPPAASPPPKTSARGRQIKTPAKFK